MKLKEKKPQKRFKNLTKYIYKKLSFRRETARQLRCISIGWGSCGLCIVN